MSLGVARGTFDTILGRPQVLLFNTLGYDWPLFTKKKSASHARVRLPAVRSDEDCRRLIAALEQPIIRGCFTLMYAYGLRIAEAVTLPVSAVDSKQMVLRVIGKGNKERILPLTEPNLQMLREVWKTHRSRRWIFPSRRLATHLSRRHRTSRVHQGTQGLRLQRPISLPTRCVTASPHTCSSRAWTSAPSRSCSVTPVCNPRRSTPT